MKRVKQRLIDFSINHAKTVYWILGLVTLLIGSQIPRIEIDTDPENMLPASNEARIFHNKVKQQFSMYDSIVVGAVQSEHEHGIYNPETLANIEHLTQAILGMEGVVKADLMSLPVVDNISQEGQGAIRFEWMMKQAPKTQEAATAIKDKIERLPLLNNTLVSGNGNATAIYVPIVDKNESYRIAQEIDQVIQSLDSKAQWHITGLPVAEDRFGYEMFVQMGISAPLAGLTIFILLFLFFRNIPFISAAMIVAMSTVIITMGLLIAMGFTVHIMSSMIAIFLMPIAVVDSVHIMSEFADRYKKGQKPHDVIREVMSHLFTPMLFTSVTSTVGFLSLMLTPIPPVQIFGAFVGFGIMLAFLTTIVFIPAYIARMSPETLAKLQASQANAHNNGSLTAKIGVFIGKLATRRVTFNLLLFVSVFVVSLIGITKIEINDNPVRWFKADHELRIADKVLNENFAGTYNAYLVLEDNNKYLSGIEVLHQVAHMPESLQDWRQETEQKLSGLKNSEQYSQLAYAIDDQLFAVSADEEIAWLETLLAQVEQNQAASKRFMAPEVLGYIEQLQTYMNNTGLVGKSNSLADVVKVVNRELHTGEAQDYQLPKTSNGVAQTLIQYQSSHRPSDLWHFVTPDYSASLIWLQLTSGDNQDMTKVMDLVAEYTANNPLPENISLNWAGKAYLNVIWQDAMVAGMLDSLTSAFIIVFIMMTLLFRSLVYGVLAMIPLTITITFIYGLIGWIGKDYDMPIAVLSALTLGLSVDFAIHFLERSRETYKQTGNLKQTFDIMFDEPASAILRNASVIALGFTPLLFAPLVPYVTVGIFLASIMAISALVTLILLPSAMIVLKHFAFGRKA